MTNASVAADRGDPVVVLPSGHFVCRTVEYCRVRILHPVRGGWDILVHPQSGGWAEFDATNIQLFHALMGAVLGCLGCQRRYRVADVTRNLSGLMLRVTLRPETGQP